MTSRHIFALPLACIALSTGCQLLERNPKESQSGPAALSFATTCPPPPQQTTLPNPCDPDWQLGRFPGMYSTFDRALGATDVDAVTRFEGMLHDGPSGSGAVGTAWFGNESVGRSDWRAVVQVDVYANGGGQTHVDSAATMPGACGDDPDLIEHGLWYLAVVPAQAADILGAVESPESRASPIGAKVLGYCYADHSFRKTDGECMSKAVSVVVKYDPRCVCGNVAVDAYVDASN